MDIITLALAKKQSSGYVDSKLDAITTNMTYKGSVASVEDLPSPATAGDIYTVNGYRYLYNGTEWEQLDSELSGEIENLKSVVNYVTPQMYGAKGDGATDDTDAIVSMFASGKTNILFPKGVYKITEDIVISTNFIDIVGAGMYNTVLELGGHTVTINSYDYRLSGIRFRQASVVEATKYHGNIRDCWFNDGNIGLKLTNAYITQVESCIFTFNTVGVVINNQSFEVIFTDCVIDNNKRCGVVVTGVSTGAIIKNCTIEGNYNRTDNIGCGICLNYGSGITEISSCWLEANGSSNDSCDIFYAFNNYNTTRLSSLFSAVNTDYALLAVTSAGGFGRVAIEDNTFRYTKYAIAVAGYQSTSLISGNTFTGTLDKYNVPVLIAGSTIIINQVHCDHNEVRNSANQSITPQMLSGINGTYIYTDLSGFTATQETALSTPDIISINAEPLFRFSRAEKRIDVNNNTSSALDYELPIYSNTAILFLCYDTCALISCNYQVTSAPVRPIYGTAPTVTMDSVNKILHIEVPAYRVATLIIAQ